MANHPLTHTRAPRRFLIWLTALIVATLTGATLAAPATAAGAMPTWQLPFENGQRWQAGAPHTSNGNNTGARGSLDFGPVSGASTHVVAVAAGAVYKITCGANFYLGVDHGNGWQSTYYHMVNLQTGLIGQTVQAGTYLGDAGQALPCGGSTTFSHVHLTIFKDGAPTPVDGFTFGNYTAHSTGSDYYGYWTDTTGATVITNTGAAKCCLLSTTQPINPDRDGDGTPDASDSCPDEPGPASNGGCPEHIWLPGDSVSTRCGFSNNGGLHCTRLEQGVWVTRTSGAVDRGYPSDRKWLVNRDGSISYCSTVGTGTSARCDTLRNGQWTSSVSAPTDLGYAGDRAWLASAQGPAECGRAGDINVQTVVCNVLTSTGWVRTTAPTPGDWGYPTTRMWLVNSLGTLSHCKTVADGTQLRCDTLANLGWSTTDPATSATAPARVDGCGSGKDTYTIPAVTGVEYLVAGTVKAAGSYPGTGTVTITARAKTGYVLTGTTTWTLSWTTTACTTTVTGNALSTPTWTVPKATLTWAATGAPAGTTLTYDVQYRAVTLSSTGARGYTTPTTWLTATTTTTGTLTGTAGTVYQIHARATDNLGTVGAWSSWKTVTMPTDDRATSFGYTGTWTTGTSASYYAGTYKLTSTAGAKVTVTAWTDQVSVIGARSTTSGKATITIDGVLKATIDTYGPTAAYRQTLATITIPYGKHTITVTNLATTGRPRLILDALAFRR